MQTPLQAGSPALTPSVPLTSPSELLPVETYGQKRQADGQNRQERIM